MKYLILLRAPLLFLVMIFVGITSFGQAGKGINYQAVARNTNGQAIVNTDLTVRIGILNTESGDEVVWLEEHQTQTNGFGILNLTIGADPGIRIGGTSPLFDQINWNEGAYAIHVQIMEPGGGFVDLGNSPISTVPYAIVSDQVKQPMAQFAIQNNGDLPPEAALFEVRRSDGRPVFSVYEDGVWVYTDTADSKGAKGGFAVGGYGRKTKGSAVEEYLRVTPDSVRIYINDDPVKGAKGGFAVGGYGRKAKAGNQDYMSVYSDSVRFHVGYNPGKGRVGGFAISGRNPLTGKSATYLFLTPDNYFIGQSSGIKNTTGIYNTIFGYRSGENNTEGSENVMLGYVAGNKNVTGDKNVFIGDSAGYSNIDGNWNVFLGRGAGLMNESGWQNVFIGGAAGEQNLTGARNVFLGTGAGLYNIEGSNNCFLGSLAGFYNNDNSNVFIGNYTGLFHEEGGDNVFIGNGAGYRNSFGAENVFIGRRAGYFSDTSSFNVAVGNRAGENLQKGQKNVLIGDKAGASIIETNHNTFIGAQAGQFTENGNWNTFLGNNSGLSNISGQDNVYIGSDAGAFIADGFSNVCIGISAGQNSSGSNNVFLGSWSGMENDGVGNVFIGWEAGRNIKGSDMLIIENSDTDENQSLIVGKFNEDKLRMNAFVGINVQPDSAFSIKTTGDIQANDVSTASDARYKTDIQSIPGALGLIRSLEGIRYRWDIESFPEMKFQAGLHYGFIAQDLEKVIPELVITGSDGYKSVNYQKISTILVEAVKQQQQILDEKEKEIRELESRLERIEKAIF